MDGFQGAVLSVKLKHLSAWNDARRKNARLYNELLADIDDVLMPVEADYARHVYHVYAIRAPNRDELISALTREDISCGIHYPVPVHLQEAYAQLGHGRNSFPVAEKCADEFVSLPMFPELSEEQIEYAVREIKYLVAQQLENKSRCSQKVKSQSM
jgi:dTDP-4-amino-4,6-dideoxygalactose transaminase